MLFQKKAPKGIEPEAGEEGVAPITEVKKPLKKKKKKAKKHSAHDAKDKKGKIGKMLGKRVGAGGIAEDIFMASKKKPANKMTGSNKGKSTRFVPEQERFGI